MVRQLSSSAAEDALSGVPGQADAPRAWPRPSTPFDTPGMSPARRLQADVELALAAELEPRWSARRRLVFMVGASALLWGGIIWAVRAVI